MNLNNKNIYTVTAVTLFLAALNYFFFSLKIILNNYSLFIEWDLFTINTVRIVISLILDWKSMLFLSTVRIISRFILIYRIYYIEGDKNFLRFILILLSFVLSIKLLIIRPNIVRLMLGWDGLGLTSYALVIFYQNEYSANSGIITVLRNRVGDSTLLLRIGWLLHMGSYNFIFYNNIDQIIVTLIIIRAFTKRAQIPFSAWLPAAIAAPTPVSALVHSSTLVTAGVFLIIRFLPTIKNRSILTVVFLFGVITILMAGWRANFETDLKKVVALSTLRQLGLIFIILGLNQELLAFFHLIIHALFKSALFMCAGFIIHNTNRRQDRRFTGSLVFSSPVLGAVFGLTNLSLCGFPFLTGFFSKDLILENSFNNFINIFTFSLIVLATGLTLSYRLRVVYITSRIKRKSSPVQTTSDFPLYLNISTIFLFIIRTLGGYFLSWVFIYKGFVFSITTREKFSIITILIVTATLRFLIITFKFNPVKRFCSHIFSLIGFLPIITKTPITVFFLNWGKNNLKLGDKGWLELSGPVNLTSQIKKSRLKINTTNNLTLITQYLTTRLLILAIVTILCYFNKQTA